MLCGKVSQVYVCCIRLVDRTSLGPRPKTNPSADRVILEAIYAPDGRMRPGDKTRTVHA